MWELQPVKEWRSQWQINSFHTSIEPCVVWARASNEETKNASHRGTSSQQLMILFLTQYHNCPNHLVLCWSHACSDGRRETFPSSPNSNHEKLNEWAVLLKKNGSGTQRVTQNSVGKERRHTSAGEEVSGTRFRFASFWGRTSGTAFRCVQEQKYPWERGYISSYFPAFDTTWLLSLYCNEGEWLCGEKRT